MMIVNSPVINTSASVTEVGQLLLSGDQQSGTDALLLSGDQQSGTDALENTETT